MNNGVKVTYLWHDADVIEVRVTVQNTKFQGTADTYLGTGELLEITAALKSFPTSSLDKREVVFGAFGEKTAGGAVKLEFYRKDQAGHSVIRATIEADYRNLKIPESATVYLDFEPAALDAFLPELERIGVEHQGSATLFTEP